MPVNVLDYVQPGDEGIGPAVTTAARAADNDDGQVYFPPGEHSIAGADLSGLNGLSLFGERGRTRLIYRLAGLGSVPLHNRHILTWNGATEPVANTRSTRLRHLTFVGTGQFAEHQHLLNASAVDDFAVEDCEFLNFQGDAIYLGRTNYGRATTVQNNGVRISDCRFDGERAGRNAVSIITGRDVTIEGCHFTRTSREGMPGAVDIEPNEFDTSAVIDSITIKGNRFRDCGGSGGDVSLAVVPHDLDTPFANLTVEGNEFDGTSANTAMNIKWHTRPARPDDPRQGITIRGNKIGEPSRDRGFGSSAVLFRGITGARVVDNEVTGWGWRAVGGALNESQSCRDIEVTGNRFNGCGHQSGYVVNFNHADELVATGNLAVGDSLPAFVSLQAARAYRGIRVDRNTLRGIRNELHLAAGATI